MTDSSNPNYLEQVMAIQAKLTEADFDLTAFMQLVAEQMHKLTPATGAVVELVDGEDMVYRAATGTVAAHIGLRLGLKNSISGLCVKSKEILRSDDTEVDPRVNLEACRKVAARSLVVAPLFYQGKTVGVLKILSRNPDAFSEEDVKTLKLMAGFIASGLAHQLSFETTNQLLVERTKTLGELQIAQDKLYHMAHYDALTDLANRRSFNEALHSSMLKARRNSSLIALLFLDIDHFKTINDTLGHDTGDELLKAFAARLKQCVRTYDLVARLGGDEFVIILNDLVVQNDAVAIADKIIAKMAEKFKLHSQLLTVTTSIGIAFYTGENISLEELIKHADNALYTAKEGGRNAYHIYVPA